MLVIMDMDPQQQMARLLAPVGKEELGEALVNQTSYVGKRLSRNAGVPVRLKRLQFADFYENVLGADRGTVDVVRHGYVIQFVLELPASSNIKK